MNLELLEFTRRALEAGASREQIAGALKQAGWSDADIRAATGAFAEIDFPTPVPKPRPYLSAQEVFTYALFFTAFYVCVYNLGALIFHFIELAYPDPAATNGFMATAAANRHSFTDDAMRGNIAALIVAFPLFLYLFQATNRAMARDPTKRASKPRKWLTYITLFIAASTLIGDLSALVYSLLGGEMTARFVLKVLTVAAIAGGAFAFFLLDIRKDERA
jgi:hypothetical protein